MNDFLEKTVEDIIFENRETIHENGFVKFYANTIRQFRLPNGKVIDLFTYEVIEDTLKFKIIELKRDKIDVDAIFQTLFYFYNIAHLSAGMFKACEPKLIIVGSDISEHGIALSDAGINIDFYFYKYCVNGIKFTKIVQKGFQWWYAIETTPPPESIDFSRKLKIV